MADELAIGIDVGGTKIAAGVVDEQGRVLARRRADTPGTDPAAVLDTIGDLVDELRGEHDVGALGIGAAGFVDASGSTVLFAPHLAWRDEPLRDAAAERTGLPVVVENDANASGWAEWRFGAVQGEPHVVLVTLGTGIGGAIVIDGKPYRGRFGLAGEFGHMQVVPDGLPCDCGNRGCWEQYASGRVLTRRGRSAAEEGTALGRRLLDAAGGSVEASTDPTSPRRRATATRRRRAGSPTWATGSAWAWPASPPPSIPASSSSAEGSAMPASSCSHRRDRPSRAR